MTETKTERLNCILRALQIRNPDYDERLALPWAFKFRAAALFLENAPQESFEAMRCRFKLLGARLALPERRLP